MLDVNPRLILLLTGWLATAATESQGGLIVTLDVAVSSTSAGRTLYEYSLGNDMTSTLAVGSFGIVVDPAANLEDILGPNGWLVDYAAGDGSIFWTSPDEGSDLAPGHGTFFQFTSILGAVLQPYQAIGFDPDDGSLAFADGETFSPGATAVPEPSSLVLVAVGLLAATTLRLPRRLFDSGPNG